MREPTEFIFDWYGYDDGPFLERALEKGFLQSAKDFVDRSATQPKIIRVNSWNEWDEWTEGSSLEPDTKHGLGYLEQIAKVFKT